jgi:biopolymer transport protein ExbD
MAMKRDPNATEDLELNMTPMIDVVFNLIIFFMVVTDLTQKEIENLTLPKSTQAEEDKGDETERRVIVNITKTEDWDQSKNVDIKIKGVPYNLEKLKVELLKHAETKRDLEDPSSPSEIFVLIRCDEDIRWREVQWVMQACADPAVRIYKLQFATRKLENK